MGTDESESGLENEEQARIRQHLPKELLDKYIIGQLLGQGTGGSVFLGFSKKSSAKVAIKVARNLAANVEEAKIQQNLRHPCIIGVIDLFVDDLLVVTVMEYARGGELYSIVEADFDPKKSSKWPASQDREQIVKLQFYQVSHRNEGYF